VGALLALLRLSIFFNMYHEKRHLTFLERNMEKYHHTITPLDITYIEGPKGQPKIQSSLPA
jgi:hypothetical protein